MIESAPEPTLLNLAASWLGTAVARLRRTSWRDILVVTFGTAAAATIALLVPNQYTTNATFIAQGSGTPLIPSALAGLAATVGISGSRDFSPQFYADLLASRPVLTAALDTQYTITSNGHSVTESYAQVEGITERDTAKAADLALKKLSRRVSTHADVRTNIITLSVTARTPTLSRDIANTLLGALNALNIRFRQEQSRDLAAFYEFRVATAQAAMDSAEGALRSFLERNRAIQNSPLLTMEQERLTRLADAKRTLYTTMAQQYEEARSQEARNVPVLTILSAPTVPVTKSAPARRLIVAAGIALAILALAGETLAKNMWREVFKRSA